MTKVKLSDRRLLAEFLKITSAIFATLSALLIFVDIPDRYKLLAGLFILIFLVVFYLVLWQRAEHLSEVSLQVDGSTVEIKVGDIFLQDGLKAIAFNEFFDTKVDERVIASASLNGQFILNHLTVSVSDLDRHIRDYDFDPGEVSEPDVNRKQGHTTRFNLGTICVFGDYLLTAFSRFDESNRATLTMPEYLEFLITFWDKVNRVYAQKSVSTPIFGSGITRIQGHKNISDEELLRIMLWTYRISEMRFKYPARLTIVIHKDKIDRINLFGIKASQGSP